MSPMASPIQLTEKAESPDPESLNSKNFPSFLISSFGGNRDQPRPSPSSIDVILIWSRQKANWCQGSGTKTISPPDHR